MAAFETPLDPTSTLDAQMGTVHGPISDDETSATLPVTDRLRGEDGAVHGGVFAALAEGLASIGTFAGVVGDGMAASGLSNDTRVLASLHEGTISAVARCRDRKPDLWTWEVLAHDDAGTLCALSVVLIAVRPAR